MVPGWLVPTPELSPQATNRKCRLSAEGGSRIEKRDAHRRAEPKPESAMGSVFDPDYDPDDEEYAELEGVYVKAETERAILVWYEGNEFWIPKSQLDDPDEYHKGYRGTLFVTLWFAEKEDIA